MPMLPSMEEVVGNALSLDVIKGIEALWYIQGVPHPDGSVVLLGLTLQVNQIGLAAVLQKQLRGLIQVITPIDPEPGKIYFQSVCQPVDAQRINEALLAAGMEQVQGPRGPYFRYATQEVETLS